MPQPQPPAVAPEPPVAPTPVAGQPAAPAAFPSGPISQEQAEFLRAKRTALSNQLESVQERRDEVADQLRNPETSSSERPGLENRLRVLDERLISIEKEMAANSAQLANAPARRSSEGSTTVPGGRDRGARGFNPNLAIVLTFMLLVPFAVQLARRWFAPNSARYDRQQSAEAAALRDRMDKMESAVEAVAIEVERIGEGQRFLTQAMSEPLARARSAAAVPVEVLSAGNVRDRDPADRR
jgi:hypothetical protein